MFDVVKQRSKHDFISRKMSCRVVVSIADTCDVIVWLCDKVLRQTDTCKTRLVTVTKTKNKKKITNAVKNGLGAGKFTSVWLSLLVIYKLKCVSQTFIAILFFSASASLHVVAVVVLVGILMLVNAVVILSPVICYTIMFIAWFELCSCRYNFLLAQAYASQSHTPLGEIISFLPSSFSLISIK